MHPIIRVGEISITFLKTRHETHGILDLFEMTIPPTNHMVLSHHGASHVHPHPGLIGPEYFHELANILNVEGPPNLAAIGSVMTRYGVVPVTT
jgi:hypothetical protein